MPTRVLEFKGITSELNNVLAAIENNGGKIKDVSKSETKSGTFYMIVYEAPEHRINGIIEAAKTHVPEQYRRSGLHYGGNAKTLKN
uniref:Uncharacterized protein n=1 Tax=viral metagenome TaxID=1070528 RepID=A0A6C0I437_9ZZZZ